jgi:hypothetical protein
MSSDLQALWHFGQRMLMLWWARQVGMCLFLQLHSGGRGSVVLRGLWMQVGL